MFGKNGYDSALKILDETYWLFSRAQKKLTKTIGVPICIPDCGKCCEINCVLIKGIEARYAALWIQRQPPEFQRKVLDVCENWLLEKCEVKENSKLPAVFRGLGTMGMTHEGIDQAVMEAAYISNKWPCPFLTEDKKCLIHPARPMTCRAYGVTRIVGQDVCPRPNGKMEEEDYRAFIRDESVEKIKEKIEQLKEQMQEKYLGTSGFIAPMIYMELLPQKFYDHVYHNEIASAKMFQFGGGFIIWQEQIQEIMDREGEMRMIINPSISTPTEKSVVKSFKEVQDAKKKS